MTDTMRELLQKLLRDIRSTPGYRELDEGGLVELVMNRVMELSYETLTMKESDELIDLALARLQSGYGILSDLIESDTIQEIMVNDHRSVFVEEKGHLYRVPHEFSDREELEEMIRMIAASVHREFNEMNPILDARLADGSRVNAVYRNVALDGPALTIRKFAGNKITIGEMIEKGTLTGDCASFLLTVMRKGYNLFISGGTSSGKTTFLNALCDVIEQSGERVVVIEDSRELMLDRIPNLVQMECHNANSAGKGLIGMDMLIRTSLRMRPDRIIVGEVRGREVADMLQAMNTGHSAVSTGHGNSVRGMMRRMEAMYLMGAQIPIDAIRAQIVEGIDICIHLARTREGKRKVMEVQELIGYTDGEYVFNPLFLTDEDGALVNTGNPMRNPYREHLYEEHDERTE